MSNHVTSSVQKQATIIGGPKDGWVGRIEIAVDSDGRTARRVRLKGIVYQLRKGGVGTVEYHLIHPGYEKQADMILGPEERS